MPTTDDVRERVERARTRKSEASQRFRRAQDAHDRLHRAAVPTVLDEHGKERQVRDAAELAILRAEAHGVYRDAAIELRDARDEADAAEIEHANERLVELAPELDAANADVTRSADHARRSVAELVAALWRLDDATAERQRLARNAVRIAERAFSDDEVRTAIRRDGRYRAPVMLDESGVVESIDLDNLAGVEPAADRWWTGIAEMAAQGRERAERHKSNTYMRAAIRAFDSNEV